MADFNREALQLTLGQSTPPPTSMAPGSPRTSRRVTRTEGTPSAEEGIVSDARRQSEGVGAQAGTDAATMNGLNTDREDDRLAPTPPAGQLPSDCVPLSSVPSARPHPRELLPDATVSGGSPPASSIPRGDPAVNEPQVGQIASMRSPQLSTHKGLSKYVGKLAADSAAVGCNFTAAENGSSGVFVVQPHPSVGTSAGTSGSNTAAGIRGKSFRVVPQKNTAAARGFLRSKRRMEELAADAANRNLANGGSGPMGSSAIASSRVALGTGRSGQAANSFAHLLHGLTSQTRRSPAAGSSRYSPLATPSDATIMARNSLAPNVGAPASVVTSDREGSRVGACIRGTMGIRASALPIMRPHAQPDGDGQLGSSSSAVAAADALGHAATLRVASQAAVRAGSVASTRSHRRSTSTSGCLSSIGDRGRRSRATPMEPWDDDSEADGDLGVARGLEGTGAETAGAEAGRSDGLRAEHEVELWAPLPPEEATCVPYTVQESATATSEPKVVLLLEETEVSWFETIFVISAV